MEEMDRRMRDLEEWRRAVDMWRGGVDSKVDAFRRELQNNTQATREAREEAKEGHKVALSVKQDTAELVELFHASKVNLAILKVIGWLLGTVGAVLGGLAAWKHWP